MSDEISDPNEEYRKTVQSIDTLTRLLRITTEPKRRVYLEGQVAKLKQFRERLESSFEFAPEELESNAVPEEGTPKPKSEQQLTFLSRIRKRYENLEMVKAGGDSEVQSVVIYMTFFEEQYIGLFDKKRLDLDHLSSQELDGFYTAFHQAKRRMEIFCDENAAASDKKDGGKLFQRIKSRQILLVEVFKFFKKIQTFAGEMLEDINTTQRHCFNGEAKLVMTPNDNTMVLNGLRVKDALRHVYDFAAEVIGYLDIPDFQK